MLRLLAALLIAVPGAASALSCRAPNPGEEVNAAADQGRPIAIVAGTLIPPGFKPTRLGHATVTVWYRLQGRRLMPDGADADFDAKVGYQSECVATWCGPLPQEPTEGLFVLRDKGGLGYLLVTGPCPFGQYAPQGPDRLQALRRCLAAGRCGEPELGALRYR